MSARDPVAVIGAGLHIAGVDLDLAQRLALVAIDALHAAGYELNARAQRGANVVDAQVYGMAVAGRLAAERALEGLRGPPDFVWRPVNPPAPKWPVGAIHDSPASWAREFFGDHPGRTGLVQLEGARRTGAAWYLVQAEAGAGGDPDGNPATLYRATMIGDEIVANAVRRAAAEITAERARQVEVEGYAPEHDDAHDQGDLLRAALLYYQQGTGRPPILRDDGSPIGWPWEAASWKPRDPARDLVRAGALAMAEVDRLGRAQRFAGHAQQKMALIEHALAALYAAGAVEVATAQGGAP